MRPLVEVLGERGLVDCEAVKLFTVLGGRIWARMSRVEAPARLRVFCLNANWRHLQPARHGEIIDQRVGHS